MSELSKNGIDIIKSIKSKTNNSPDIIIKGINILDTNIYIVFNENLCDRMIINEYVLEFFELKKHPTNEKDVLKYIKEQIPTHKTNKIGKYDELFYNLFSGFTVIIVDGYEEALTIETRSKLDSGVLEAQAEVIIKGPKDAFTENYQTNIGLIRRRLKTENLWLHEQVLGTKSKTKVGVMYVQDIVDMALVKQVCSKIDNINIDAILDSNYLIELISGNKRNVFPIYLSTERPDLVVSQLLNGKIAIVQENTQYVVIIPVTFIEFFHSSEDFYQKTLNVNYTRLIRLFAFFITLFTPALYLAITTHNQEAIPTALFISFAAQRGGVPFPSIIEALLMLMTFEILKETDIRSPSTIGSALSIVGALVLGQAAAQAGVVSPIMVIVIAITAISGLGVSYSEITYGIRWWRILFIIASSVLGLIGVFMASLILVINLASIKSFGIPYLSPIAPYNKNNQANGIFLNNKYKFFQRNILTAKKNKYRSAGND